MGTYYECTYGGPFSPQSLQPGIDSLLDLVNATASTYIPTSFISEFNQIPEKICVDIFDARVFHWRELMKLSAEVVDVTDGFFDPSLMPLINYWGFGYKERKSNQAPDTNGIKSIMPYIGFDRVHESSDDQFYCMRKDHPQAELDMNAIAKGYAVDLLAAYIKRKGSENYYVNIGGEVVTYGLNDKGKHWTLGINYPDTSAGLRELYATVQLNNVGMASSGNYRNYYTSKGMQYGHTINPKTGMATPSDLVSVTIVASDCATADAYATACMAMGYDRGRSLVEAHADLQGFFIYKNNKKTTLQHYATPKLLDKLKINK